MWVGDPRGHTPILRPGPRRPAPRARRSRTSNGKQASTTSSNGSSARCVVLLCILCFLALLCMCLGLGVDPTLFRPPPSVVSQLFHPQPNPSSILHPPPHAGTHWCCCLCVFICASLCVFAVLDAEVPAVLLAVVPEDLVEEEGEGHQAAQERRLARLLVLFLCWGCGGGWARVGARGRVEDEEDKCE